MAPGLLSAEQPRRAWEVCAIAENVECRPHGTIGAASGRPLSTFPASLSFSAPPLGLRLQSAGRGASTGAPITHLSLSGPCDRPAEGATRTRGVRLRTSPGLCGVSRRRGTTCTSPAASAAGKTQGGG